MVDTCFCFFLFKLARFRSAPKAPQVLLALAMWRYQHPHQIPHLLDTMQSMINKYQIFLILFILMLIFLSSPPHLSKVWRRQRVRSCSDITKPKCFFCLVHLSHHCASHHFANCHHIARGKLLVFLFLLRTIYVYLYLYVYVCMCMCVCVCVYIYDYHIAVSIKTLAPFEWW